VRNSAYFKAFPVYYSILVKVTTIKSIQLGTASSFTSARGCLGVKTAKAINPIPCNNWIYGVHNIFINKVIRVGYYPYRKWCKFMRNSTYLRAFSLYYLILMKSYIEITSNTQNSIKFYSRSWG